MGAIPETEGDEFDQRAALVAKDMTAARCNLALTPYDVLHIAVALREVAHRSAKAGRPTTGLVNDG